VQLTYVDWVGRDRLRVSLVRNDGGTIEIDRITESKATAVGAPIEWHDVPAPSSMHDNR